MSFEALKTSFKALEMSFETLESIFEDGFGRKVAGEGDPRLGCGCRQTHDVGHNETHNVGLAWVSLARVFFFPLFLNWYCCSHFYFLHFS
jgi:hypothetical protein